MFETLDRVFLMARGKVLFAGEPAAADRFFEAAGLACPTHTALAEHMLSAVSDPPMLTRLQSHVAEHGPFAGIALVCCAYNFGLTDLMLLFHMFIYVLCSCLTGKHINKVVMLLMCVGF